MSTGPSSRCPASTWTWFDPKPALRIRFFRWQGEEVSPESIGLLKTTLADLDLAQDCTIVVSVFRPHPIFEVMPVKEKVD